MLGAENEAVRIQGLIDRVDVLDLGDETRFRVIDYKSGSAPAKADVRLGIALQLHLYAMAVERTLVAGENARPLDVGYWSLKNDGYKAIENMAAVKDGRVEPASQWVQQETSIERYVLALVRRLRAAAFPVAPRRTDCTRTCDFQAACRISQVRKAGRSWADEPRLEAPERRLVGPLSSSLVGWVWTQLPPEKSWVQTQPTRREAPE